LSQTEQSGLVMKLGTDDQAKVYLNGKQIYRNDQPRPCPPDQDKVGGVELKAGMNALVFKVVNAGGDWKGSMRLTDAAGRPGKGIRVNAGSGQEG